MEQPIYFEEETADLFEDFLRGRLDSVRLAQYKKIEPAIFPKETPKC